MAAVVDTMEPRMARPPVLSTSTPAAAPLPADHLLPEGLFDGPLPSSVNAQKLLGMSSAYLCHSLLDINTNGYVTPCELQHGLATIGLDLTDEQMDMLVERYDDAPRNGLFERNELLPLFDHLKLHCVVGSQKKVLRGAQRHLFFTKIGAVAGGRSIDDVKTEHELVKKLSTTCPQYLSYSLFDTNSNGFITGEELKSGLQALAKIEVTDEQINKLVEKYDDNKNGVLEPCEVIPMFDDITKYKSISALLNASEYERVYGACAKYLTYAAFEKDDEGFITPRELKSGLKELGKRLESEGLRFDLSDEEINVIVQKYDDNNNNVLEPEEVAEFIDDFFAADCSIDHVLATPRAVSSTEIIPWQVNHKLLTYSSEYLTHSLMDSNTNGYITGCELQSGLRALGVRMSDEQFEILAARYDDNRNGVFEREEIEPLFDDLKVHVLLCGYP
mmetsp:Transcript_24010/g.42761  ORF Transcript_24010/g.42761 Transcript_24010/m.42761 type:complete len:446 (-) Transcript_24010:117-1454(-)